MNNQNENEKQNEEKRLNELKNIAQDAMEAILKMTNNKVVYDHRLRRFIDLS